MHFRRLFETEDGFEKRKKASSKLPVFLRKLVVNPSWIFQISSWTKFWVRLYQSELSFHEGKGKIRSSERHHVCHKCLSFASSQSLWFQARIIFPFRPLYFQFKQNPYKIIVLEDWMVLYSSDRTDSFQLSNPNQGNIYRYVLHKSKFLHVSDRI